MIFVGLFSVASESARWLMCHQRFTEAEMTLKEIISCNASTVPDFLSLFDKSRACVVTNMHNKRYTFLDLFYSLETTKWTLALTYAWWVSLLRTHESLGIMTASSTLACLYSTLITHLTYTSQARSLL